MTKLNLKCDITGPHKKPQIIMQPSQYRYREGCVIFAVTYGSHSIIKTLYSNRPKVAETYSLRILVQP